MGVYIGFVLLLKDFKKFFLYSLIGSLVISALVAVIVVLIGEFDTITTRVLFTLFMVILHSLISLGFIWDNERQKTFEKLAFFSNVLFFLIVASFITSIFGVWEIISGDLLWKIYQVYFLTGFASLHADILSKVLDNDKTIDSVVYSNYLFMAVVYLMLLPMIFMGDRSDSLPQFYYRFISAMGIIDGTLSVLTIILYKLYLAKHPTKVDPLAVNYTKLETVPQPKRSLSIWVWILIVYLVLQMVVPLFFFGLKMQTMEKNYRQTQYEQTIKPVVPTIYNSQRQGQSSFCKNYATYQITKPELGSNVDIEEITAYYETSGNIKYNPQQPMFGVDAPNSGTGPFVITDRIADKILGINNGSCVTVVYGSGEFDSQKTVIDIFPQY